MAEQEGLVRLGQREHSVSSPTAGRRLGSASVFKGGSKAVTMNSVFLAPLLGAVGRRRTWTTPARKTRRTSSGMEKGESPTLGEDAKLVICKSENHVPTVAVRKRTSSIPRPRAGVGRQIANPWRPSTFFQSGFNLSNKASLVNSPTNTMSWWNNLSFRQKSKHQKKHVFPNIRIVKSASSQRLPELRAEAAETVFI